MMSGFKHSQHVTQRVFTCMSLKLAEFCKAPIEQHYGKLIAFIKNASQNQSNHQQTKVSVTQCFGINDPFDLPQIKRRKMSIHSSLHPCTVICAQKQVWCSNQPLLSLVERGGSNNSTELIIDLVFFFSSHVFTSKGMHTWYTVRSHTKNIYTMFTLPRD